MVRQIVPVFFTTNIEATLAYYEQKLGFECTGKWDDPPVYAIVQRDQLMIHFRSASVPLAPDKYDDELLDAYIYIQDADALYSDYAARGVQFERELCDREYGMREFLVRDCDGRLLAFGAELP
jgi:catechol 2,3-dioxygenase-like lactoylglutathione lyase family enzyme